MPCDTAITGTGAVGVSTKLKTLSRGRASTGAPPAAPRRTTARVFGVVSVSGANEIDADAFGATLIVRSCTTRPSISRWIGTLVAAVAVRFNTPAVTVTRSCWPSRVRSNATGVSARLAPCAPSTTAVVTVVPPGSRSVSSGCQPPRWKSDTRITSLRGSSDSASRLPASFNAGPYLVDPGPGDAALISATARDAIRRRSQRDLRGVGEQHHAKCDRPASRSSIACAAARCARDHESP